MEFFSTRHKKTIVYGGAFCIVLVLVTMIQVNQLRPRWCQSASTASVHTFADSRPWISNTTLHAEKLWKQGKGYLWLQHLRKGDGTKLCSVLIENTVGMIRKNTHFQVLAPNKYPNCQMSDFCDHCNLKEDYPNPPELASQVRQNLDRVGRNYFEAKYFGGPPDIWADYWSDFVFITTLRHPLGRIESVFRRDSAYNKCIVDDEDSVRECLRDFLDTDNMILDVCDQNPNLCISNYLIRTFSGHENNFTTPGETLDLAKTNFKRYSCVVLQESWDSTDSCLGEKLGLYQKYPKGHAFLKEERKKLSKDQGVTIDDSVERLQNWLGSEMYDRLVRLNQADLEFYEWAKKQILTASESDDSY